MMDKKKTSQIITTLLLTGLLGFFAYKQREHATQSEPVTTAASQPESVVWRMVDASRSADTEQYLACYTGELERLLRQNLKEMGAAKFRDYLSNSLRPVKGIAVSTPEATAPSEKRVSVEYVYEDRNEKQQVYLRQVGKEWKILRVEATERMKTLVPYGAPVTD